MKIAHIFAGFSGAVGAAATIGWLTSTPILYKPFPGAVPMAFPTAFMFVFSALIIFILTAAQMHERRYPFVAAGSFMLLFSCASTLSWYIRGHKTLPINDIEVPPAIATLVCFTLMAMAGLLMDNHKATRIIGGVIAFAGLFGIVGYSINQPWMYWEFNPYTVGMALMTSIAFASLGLGLYYVPQEEEELHHE